MFGFLPLDGLIEVTAFKMRRRRVLGGLPDDISI